jgi:RNA polymerase-interacting CarD/CdnL/TRCF family regulator
MAQTALSNIRTEYSFDTGGAVALSEGSLERIKCVQGVHEFMQAQENEASLAIESLWEAKAAIRSAALLGSSPHIPRLSRVAEQEMQRAYQTRKVITKARRIVGHELDRING